jgi:hypothetical protein
MKSERLMALAYVCVAIGFTACGSEVDSSAGDSSSEAALRGGNGKGGNGDADPNDGGGGQEKVTICHIPPGNPANAHSITIGAPGVPAHLAHGDSLGECAPVAPVPRCGDGAIDAGETCDGADLAGQDCFGQGFAGGTLGCTATCDAFDTSQCTDG